MSGGALGARREADGLTWWSEGSSSRAWGEGAEKWLTSPVRECMMGVLLCVSTIPLPRASAALLRQNVQGFLSPCLQPFLGSISQYFKPLFFKKNVLPFC